MMRSTLLKKELFHFVDDLTYCLFSASIEARTQTVYTTWWAPISPQRGRKNMTVEYTVKAS